MQMENFKKFQYPDNILDLPNQNFLVDQGIF